MTQFLQAASVKAILPTQAYLSVMARANNLRDAFTPSPHPKPTIGHHRRGMGPRARGNWPDRVTELHRELHRREAEASAQAAATPSADAS